jgi:hypothetical protein
MKNFNRIPIGNNIGVLCGYAHTTTDRLGPITMQFENTGTTPTNSFLGVNIPSQIGTTARITVLQFVPSGTTTNGIPQGTWQTLVSPFLLGPGCRKDIQAVVFARTIGIFGSGNTVVTLEIPYSHAAALRGQHIDIQPVGRVAYGFDIGIDRNHLFPAPLT